MKEWLFYQIQSTIDNDFIEAFENDWKRAKKGYFLSMFGQLKVIFD